MAPSIQRERRRFVRVPFEAPVQVAQIPQPSPDHVCRLWSTDLSVGGIQLSASEAFPLESILLLDLKTLSPGDLIRGVGRVAWAQPATHENRWQVGVQFAELSNDARSQLRKIVTHRQVMRLR